MSFEVPQSFCGHCIIAPHGRTGTLYAILPSGPGLHLQTQLGRTPLPYQVREKAKGSFKPNRSFKFFRN